ncbi:FUSC family protein [Heyndrickxia acidicola]|uniref:Aromatic acid exporter family protein n=1 Tax=Heyndrickxia acidicola TaxID=209389 RepID=A0ABU6MAB3_9BACI|nr:FUSC family protein [Heyndrickxia acidicola]MED1201593.1 aromatic acid exporter family protein [Heyndrickxia acidicola]
MKTLEQKELNNNIAILIWNMAAGSALAWYVSNGLGSAHPYLAPLSVILCLQSTFSKTFLLSLKRIIGTVIGILVSVLIASYLTFNGWELGLLILIGCYITKWFRFDRIVLHQVALTILFVFAFEHKTSHYATDRMRDTIVGVAVAIIIQYIWSRVRWKNQLRTNKLP